MSRTARNVKLVRSGAIGFVAGLAVLGVVASGSPARMLLGDATAGVRALSGDREPTRGVRAQQQAQSQDMWLAPSAPSAQQQLPQVQPEPSQPPQSRAS